MRVLCVALVLFSLLGCAQVTEPEQIMDLLASGNAASDETVEKHSTAGWNVMWGTLLKSIPTDSTCLDGRISPDRGNYMFCLRADSLTFGMVWQKFPTVPDQEYIASACFFNPCGNADRAEFKIGLGCDRSEMHAFQECDKIPSYGDWQDLSTTFTAVGDSACITVCGVYEESLYFDNVFIKPN